MVVLGKLILISEVPLQILMSHATQRDTKEILARYKRLSVSLSAGNSLQEIPLKSAKADLISS